MLKLSVAVTGGIGCGKSTVCELFHEMGARVLSADAIVHQLLSPETEVGKAVIQLLGPGIIVGERIDRKRVADRVFSDEKLRTNLEKIIHPAVKTVLQEERKAWRQSGQEKLFVADIPLLFEAGWEGDFDRVVLVVAPEKEAFRRSSLQRGDFVARMERFLPESEKRERADFVLENSGTKEELKRRAQVIYQQISERST